MLGGGAPVVLAVSGGVDSMVLFDAAVAVVPLERLTVATLDHGTGEAAASASALVQRRAAAIGVRCVAARVSVRRMSEASLRQARWAFLRRVAAEANAIVATAHSEDDQVETVLMRILRGAGARGLAGLYAKRDVVRPLLGVTRSDIMRYAAARHVEWAEDPTNVSRVFLRNRVRHDLLPALRRVRPSIDRELLAVAHDAADWREHVEAIVAGIPGLRVMDGGRGVDVPIAAFRGVGGSVAAMLWPPVAARAGVTLDRRGTERLASFTARGRVGARIQLAGGWDVVRSRDAFQLRPSNTTEATAATLALSDGTRWGDWSFRPTASDGGKERDAWSAWLPVDCPLTVRHWQPGDAMTYRPGARPRKVKHLLSDAGVTGHQRAGWPVVLAGDQIVWVPGVRRGDAATARSGRPGLPFVCEYINR